MPELVPKRFSIGVIVSKDEAVSIGIPEFRPPDLGINDVVSPKSYVFLTPEEFKTCTVTFQGKFGSRDFEVRKKSFF